jgi:hypothetical protein
MSQLKSQQRTERCCNLFEELRDWATTFSWTIISHRLLFDDLFQQKINACKKLAKTGVECHNILEEISNIEKGT